MSECKLWGYGENAATFLIFQALAMKHDALTKIFIERLKQFGKGTTIKWDNNEVPEVWLFPNFGKGRGFGEPDVLILAGSHRFWVEVETTINCQRGIPSLRKSLLQLWRFCLFQHAMREKVQVRRNSRRIVGITLKGNGELRPAEVRLAGHGVLQRIREKLTSSGEDHYVLFTVNQPTGEGTGRRLYSQVLRDEVERMGQGYPNNLPRLPVDRCWYAYWKGDLERPFNQLGGTRLDLEDCYVRIKRS